MKIEDLKNTKIYLSNEEDRKKFQEKVFELGVKWSEESVVNNTNGDMFFTIDNYLHLFLDWGKTSFINNKRKQIFLDEVLAIEEPKEEYKFNRYDKVLVRDHKSQRWYPTLYFYYDSEFAFPHVTVAGTFYKYCIPYEGNEHLVGTTNSKEHEHTKVIRSYRAKKRS